MEKIPVGVLFGGKGGEHSVSLRSASAVLAALPSEFIPFPIGITRQGHWFYYKGPAAFITDGAWEKDAAHLSPVFLPPGGGFLQTPGGNLFPKVIFPVLHGAYGEDGTLQGLLAHIGIPFVGCACTAGAICMNKELSKRLASVPTAKWISLHRRDLFRLPAFLQQAEDILGFPQFVKPACGGSSLGAGIAHDPRELEKRILLALTEDDTVLCEEFLRGKEIEVGVLEDGDALITSPPGEIQYPGEFYDYTTKYKQNAAKIIIPANIPAEAASLCRRLAERIFRALGCRHLARVDFFLTTGGEVLFNEINTMPGFTKTSMYPLLMEKVGYDFPSLCGVLLRNALDKPL